MKFVDTQPSLLARIRDGTDRAAWEEFVELYAPVVYGYAIKYGLQEADAADFTQDTILGLMRSLKSFEYDRSRGSFRGWLVTVLRNRLKRAGLQAARQDRGSGDSTVLQQLNSLPTSQPDDTWEHEVKLSEFHWAAQRIQPEFQPNTWSAFWQTTVVGQTIQQVAEQLGITAGAVYVARSRVLARLRTEVQLAESGWTQ
jgi:RNA polymerase sigma factor (sigma-70 family)